MRVLVTGGAGFIGSALTAALLDQGHATSVFDSLVTGDARAVPEGAELVKGDLRDPEELRRACAGAEVVFHQAALRSVPRSLDDPLLTTEANVTGTLNLLQAAAEAGCRRVVYASSSSVYGDIAQLPAKEDAPTAPLSPYAVSKLAGENYCRVWSHLGRVETVSLRYFNVFGPGQRPDSRYSAVFPGFISALRRGDAPEVYGDGRQTRDFTFVADVVDANIRAATSPGVAGQVFNIATGNPRSVIDVLDAIAGEMGIHADPTFLAPRPGDVRHTHADISKAETMLGWQPRTSWPQAIAATVAWFAADSAEGA